MTDLSVHLTAVLDGHTCGSTASLPDGRRDRSCPGCIAERDQQWSEALDPSCLAEFTPGIAAEFVKALEEAAEREKARADRAERELSEIRAKSETVVHTDDACGLVYFINRDNPQAFWRRKNG